MKSSHAWSSLSLVSLFALVACGGSDGGSPTPPPPANPPPAALSLSGTAAAGPALAGAAVEIKCATGTGNATAGADGSFQADVAGGVLPCTLRATSGATVLHSIVAAGGSSVVVNVTPLTELMAANVAGASPDAFFTTFDATAQARLTAAAVTQALATVRASLQGTLDLTGVDPIGAALAAAHGSVSGNAADAQLNALATALAADHVTLADLAAVLETSTASTARMLAQLAPSATSCPALRSGTYVTVDPGSTIGDPDFAAYHLTIDAQTLVANDVEPGHDPDSVTLTPVAGQPCRFTFGDAQSHTLLVGASGVMVAQGPSSTGPLTTEFVVPAQVVATRQLAGNWNRMSYTRQHPGDALAPGNGTFAIDATGHFTAGTECTALTCTDTAASDLPAPLVPNAAGGYTVADTDGSTIRVFPVVADNGVTTLFALVPNEGGWSILTQQSAVALPQVGDVNTFYDLQVFDGGLTWAPDVNSAQGADTAAVSSTITVTAVDPAAQSFTRLRASDQRVDSLVINDPRDGMRYRAAGATFGATLQMPLRGTGVTVYTSASSTQNFFGISVNHP